MTWKLITVHLTWDTEKCLLLVLSGYRKSKSFSLGQMRLSAMYGVGIKQVFLKRGFTVHAQIYTSVGYGGTYLLLQATQLSRAYRRLPFVWIYF